MILVGTMNLTRTRESGQFYCPTCGSNQPFRLRARRPFLTIYFIPVVPVGGPELFVVCDGCRDKWDETVLALDQQEHEEIQEQQFREEALRSSVLVVLEDDKISEAEIAALERIASELFDRTVDREELGELCSAAEQNKIKARNYVLSVSTRWSEAQKSRALQAMFLAATAEGEMGDAQIELLSQMRELLEMTQNEYQQTIEAALQWDDI